MTSALPTFADYLSSAFESEVALIDSEPSGTTDVSQLLGLVRDALERARVGLLVCPADGLLRQPADLEHLLEDGGLGDRTAFVGWTRARQLLAVLDRHVTPAPSTPADFRVVAIVPTYNEADIVEHTLRYLLEEGVQVYLLDNWSTDGTPDIAARVGSRLGGLFRVERFPPEAPPTSYDLRRILSRVEEVAAGLDANWVVLHDADERRRSPWPGLGLRDALFLVDQRGFNCVDHITLNFWPTFESETYDGTRDVEHVLRYFAFSDHPGHFHQRRAWKQTRQRVSLAATAGHDVTFPGRRVFPYRFLLKHYPIRSQAHGERKVLAERLPRWNPTERAFGWHAQYDAFAGSAGPPRFVRHASELTFFDAGRFYQDWLVERLSGVGAFWEPPAWATPPLWRPLPTAA